MTAKAPALSRWRGLVGWRGDRLRLKEVAGRSTEGQAEERADYIPAIDGLRAVAVLSVLIFHLHRAALPGGFVGVDVFFVISGFVVTRSLSNKHFNSLFDLISYFYVRRILRIIPALIVMLLVSVAVFVAIVPQQWHSKASQDVAKGAFLGISNIVLSLQTDDYFAVRPAYNPFTHTWSLGVEEQFYLVFPFMLFWHLHKRRSRSSIDHTILAIAFLSALSLAICGLLTSVRWPLAFYLMPARFWELGAGMLLCLTIQNWRPLAGRLKRRAQLVLACVSAGAITSVYPISASTMFPFPLAVLPVVGTVLVIVQSCALPRSPITRTLSSPLAVAIGKRSYSLYLWHWPVFVYFRWTVGLESAPTALTAVALTFIATEASYRFVELGPLRRRVASTSPRWIVISVGLALIGTSGAAARFALNSPRELSLSQTTKPGTWYVGSKPLNPAFTHCQVQRAEDSFFGATVRTWTARNCSIPPQPGQLIAIGDSHGLAYMRSLAQFAGDTGRVVRLYHSGGCPYAKITKPRAEGRRCRDFYAALDRKLLRETQRGDVVFLAHLKMPIGSAEDGQAGAQRAAEERTRLSDMAKGSEELSALSRALGVRGVTVVVEGPKPTFPSSTIMCSDWFNRGNPVCKRGFSVKRSEMEKSRGPIVRRIAAIAEAQPNLLVWDPFPLLCPGEVCHAYLQGKPLFIDGHHLSAYANDLLYPNFRNAMQTAFGRTLHQAPNRIDGVPSQPPRTVLARAKDSATKQLTRSRGIGRGI
jgi:peptidoglycan/LPS O-acetylase OafA/YrhL